MPYDLQGPVVRDGTWTLTGVDVVSPTARNKSTSAYYKIRVGMREGGNTTWVGSWSQAASGLAAGTSLGLLETSRRGMRLKEGSSGVVEVTKVGSPADIVGMAVTFRMQRVGDSRGSVKPIVNTPATDDPAMRAVIDHLNTGSGEVIHSVPLVAETPAAATVTTPAAYHDYESSAATVSSTTYIDGRVSVTVTVPSGATSVYVLVNAFATIDGNAAAAIGHLAIGDGSSELVETRVRTGGVGWGRSANVSYAATITSDTTFKTRVKRTTANADFTWEGISALAVAQ